MLILLLNSWHCLAEPTPHQEPLIAPAQTNGELSHESLDAKIKSITDKQGLDEAIKSKIIANYQATKENLDNLIWYKNKTAAYQEILQSASTKLKNLQNEITHSEQILKEKSKEKFQTIPTDELEQRYIIEKGKLSDIDDESKKIETENVVENNRPQLIRSETISAKQGMETAQQKLEEMPAVALSKPETEALQLYLKTIIDARSAELKMLDLEALSNPPRTQLLKLNLQLLDLKKQILAPTIANIEEELAVRRQDEASKVREELTQIEKELYNKHPLIQSLTKENIQYSRDLQSITLKLEQYRLQKSSTDNQTAQIEADFKSAEKKISLAGLSPALGKILREQRHNLTLKDEFFLKSEALQTETAVASLTQFKIADRLKQLADVDSELKRVMLDNVDASIPAEQRLRIKAELRILLNNQKELLDKLDSLYVDYIRTLGDIDFSRQQLQMQADKYAAFLDKRLLWVPSSLPLDFDYPVKVYQSLKWLFAPSNWVLLTQDTFRTFVEHPVLGSIALFSLLLLQIYKQPLKELINKINLKVTRPATDHFYYTLQNLVYTLVLVAPFALLLNYLGWFLSSNMQLSSFTKAVGVGLRETALPLFFLQFFKYLFTPEGIARKHFHWRKSVILLIRQQLQRAINLLVPSVFLIQATNTYENVIHTDSLGRLALIISMLTLAFLFGTLFHPKNEILPRAIRENPSHWLNRFHLIWYSMGILIPLTIIGFSVTGYYLSALELQEKLIVSLRMIFTAIIVHEIVVRWLVVVNRQLALQNARQAELIANENRQQLEAAQTPVQSLPTQGSDAAIAGNPNAAIELLDIPAINAQTLKILNVILMVGLAIGGYVVWRDIVPAFSFFDQVILWQHSLMIDNQLTNQPVTLTNLLFAIVLIIIAFITVRNLPGVMELVVFQRVSVESGSRYAINQLSKYLILMIAFITVANELGGSWSQVQWLAAALSVGLGFGLQEIFANLVSGIILLFERPIRVGDTLTVGNTTGVVNRIQMRATTLIDSDKKELIVPNKTFLTSQLVNWTLTDSTTRLSIPIGIAYGSNVDLALQIMLETIKSIPQVLATPEPSVLFIGFGDNSLNFSIRLFVAALSDRWPVTHQLHLRLEQAFREHQISIPFPQQEVYVHQSSGVQPRG